MMIHIFERIALVTAGGLVSGLVAIAVMNPPEKTTTAPKADLNMLTQAHASGGSSEGTQKAQRFLPIKARGSEVLAGINVRSLETHSPVSENSAENLDKSFSAMGYDLDQVRRGDTEVPRVFLASMPEDLDQVRQVPRKKALFFKALLPLVLQMNAEITNDRRRLWELQSQLKKGIKPSAANRLWLIVMAERYKVKRGNISELIKRVDIIPVSLALAQAAEESGWGTSRFAREGNAMFGQWTTTGKGLVPEKRDDGKTHKVQAFESLLHSARSYARNLNTHRAYRELRTLRQELRRQGEQIQGMRLAEKLTAYSERGEEYVAALRALIVVNKLRYFDDARLNTDA